MQQHVLDDGVGSLAVLHDFFEIVLQQPVNSSTSCRTLPVSVTVLEQVVQFTGQFSRHRREIVDEIERVLDLMRDPSGELAKRGELFGLHQAILRGAEVIKGF